MSGLVGLLSTYGLAGIFLGCLAEGETFAMSAGLLAHQHVFSLMPALATVFAGAFLGDLCFFLAGRKLSHTRLVEKMTGHRAFNRARDLIARHPVMFILTNRFVYGIRTVGGLAAGMSGVSMILFMVLNAISAAIWTSLFVGIGWVFGLAAWQVMGHLFETHKGFVVVSLILLVLVSVAVAIVVHRKRKRRATALGG